jgi:HEAT repeat protein
VNRKLLLCLALVLGGGLLAHANGAAANERSTELISEFKNCRVFWQQFEIGEKIVALHDTNVLQSTILLDGLTNEDRHARGNTAFIFAALGDERGFETLHTILSDRSPRPAEITDDALHPSLRAQIEADRYYDIHLFGDLKDPRVVPILIPLLHDDEVNYIVPWSLGEIGDKRAIPPLIEALDDKAPSMRALAIYALAQLHATQALPRLRELLNDNDRSNFGDLVSVAGAARGAITQLEAKP